MKTRIVWTFALLLGFAAVESPDASASPQLAAKVDRFLPRQGLFAQAETQDLRPGDEFVAGGELYRVASTGRFVGTAIVPGQLELLHRPYDRRHSRSPTPDDVVWLVSSDAGGLQPGHYFLRQLGVGGVLVFQGKRYRVEKRDGQPVAVDTGFVVQRVGQRFVRPQRAVWELTLADDRGATQSLRATPDHPFFVPALNRYVALSDLRPGERLRSQEGLGLRVLGAHPISARWDTFDIEVPGTHNYLVVDPARVGGGGSVVHNSTAAPSVRERVLANIAESRAARESSNFSEYAARERHAGLVANYRGGSIRRAQQMPSLPGSRSEWVKAIEGAKKHPSHQVKDHDLWAQTTAFLGGDSAVAQALAGPQAMWGGVNPFTGELLEGTFFVMQPHGVAHAVRIGPHELAKAVGKGFHVHWEIWTGAGRVEPNMAVNVLKTKTGL